MIVFFGLVGCSGNNRSNVNDITRPIGYYSNENHPNRMPNLFHDDDGPIVEYLDHTFGTERRNIQNQKKINLEQTNAENNPPPSPMPLIVHDQTQVDQRHGMNTKDGKNSELLQGEKINRVENTKTLGMLSDQIRVKAASVKNVYDVRSVVLDSSVFLSVHLKDKRQAETTKTAIQNAIKPLTAGRAVTIITNEQNISKRHIIKDEVREGGAR